MKWFVFRIIKLVRRFCMRSWRRIVSLAFVSALLLSCVSVGVTNVQEVKAVAVADDYAMLAEALKVIVTYACSAAGATNSDIVATTSSENITEFKGAQQYVHDTFSGDSSFSRIFKFNPVTMLKVEKEIAKSAIAGGRILRKSFLKKVWSQYKVTTDVKDRIPDLSEEDELKVEIFAHEWVKNLSINPPNNNDNDDDNDDDSDDYDEHGQYKPKGMDEPFVLDTKALGAVPSMVAFKVIYTLTKFLNEEDAEKQFEKDNYSWQWWKDSSMSQYSPLGNYLCLSPFLRVSSKEKFFTYTDSDNNKYDGKNYYLGFGYDFISNSYYASASYKYYPITFLDNNKPKFIIATDNKGVHGSDKLVSGGFFEKNDVYCGKELTAIDSFSSSFQLTNLYNDSYVIDWNDNFVNNAVKNYSTLPSGTVCDMPWVLKCKDKNDADKVVSMIKTGNFSKDDIMPYLVDGWKSNRKKSWQTVDDDGKTAKKIVESGKADKYTTKGKKKKSDGTTETGAKGVTWKSFVDGMSQIGDFSSSAVGVSSLLGEQTDLTSKITYPSFKDYPETITRPDTETGTETDTETGTGTGTGTETGTETGTGTGTGTDTDKDEKLEDIKPDETKTPQLLKKFPFCIPWDVVDLVSSVSAEKKAPRWELPFKMGNEIFGYKVDEKIVIDFSKYESLAVICRWFFRIMFILGLVMITRYLIKG